MSSSSRWTLGSSRIGSVPRDVAGAGGAAGDDRAGYVNHRALVRAPIEGALAAGAFVVAETVLQITETPDGVDLLANTGVKMFGLHSNLWERDRAPMRAQFPRSYVMSVSSTIAAGTSEVQRKIIATRGLGLPCG